MNGVLKEVLSGKDARLVMFLAHVGRDVTHDIVGKYCSHYGLKSQTVWNYINNLWHKGILSKVYVNS